jgi:hypothetical protein
MHHHTLPALLPVSCFHVPVPTFLHLVLPMDGTREAEHLQKDATVSCRPLHKCAEKDAVVSCRTLHKGPEVPGLRRPARRLQRRGRRHVREALDGRHLQQRQHSAWQRDRMLFLQSAVWQSQESAECEPQATAATRCAQRQRAAAAVD